MARSFDWSRYRLGIFVRATRACVYGYLATAAGQEAWFPQVAVFQSPSGKRRRRMERARTGDGYFQRFIYAGGVEGTGKVLASRRDSRFKISFGGNGDVDFALKSAPGGTLVTLTQDRIPTSAKARVDAHMGCRTGWTFFLTNLKSVAEGGPDLRETDPKRARDTTLVNM